MGIRDDTDGDAQVAPPPVHPAKPQQVTTSFVHPTVTTSLQPRGDDTE